MKPWNPSAEAALWLAVFLASLPAGGMTINLTYDTSVTSLGAPTNAQVEAGVNAAAQTLENLYTNPISINITVYWGATGPFTNGLGLGSSQSAIVGNPTYSQLTSALRAVRTTPADTNAVASLPASDPAGGPWWIPRAEMKALNLSGFGVSPNDGIHDGDIGFATDLTYTFDATNRAVPGEFDFIGVAEHEISEVMGRNFILNYLTTGYVPYDLFRFTNNGARSFSVNATNAYFSVDDGVTALKFYFTNVNFGDVQDWLTSSPADAYDALISSGQKSPLSSADLTVLDVLGYDLHFTTPRLAGKNLGNGIFQLSFTNTPGLDFSILASTNIAVSVTNWNVLGTPTENPAGQYKFTDSVTNKALFYRVRLN
jgi:hypothetical protein